MTDTPSLPALREAVAVSQTPIGDYDTELFHREVL